MIFIVYLVGAFCWLTGMISVVRSCKADDTRTFLDEAGVATLLFLMPFVLYYFFYLPAANH